MNGFVRRMAVLSVLWSTCELLLPEGRNQQMARMTVGVLIMTSLLSGLNEWAGQTVRLPAWSEQVMAAGEESYQRTALAAYANQIENYCVRQAKKAGYTASAAVWLMNDGTLERIEMKVTADGAALLSAEELASHLALQLETDEEHIRLEEL